MQLNAVIYSRYLQGIAPTLIIVRIQLGVSTNSIDESIGMPRSTASLSGSHFEIVAESVGT